MNTPKKKKLYKHTGTPQYSVRPLPVRPSTPNELLSSNKTRKRYFSFSLMILSKGAIWPEFYIFNNQRVRSSTWTLNSGKKETIKWPEPTTTRYHPLWPIGPHDFFHKRSLARMVPSLFICTKVFLQTLLWDGCEKTNAHQGKYHRWDD